MTAKSSTPRWLQEDLLSQSRSHGGDWILELQRFPTGCCNPRTSCHLLFSFSSTGAPERPMGIWGVKSEIPCNTLNPSCHSGPWSSNQIVSLHSLFRMHFLFVCLFRRSFAPQFPEHCHTFFSPSPSSRHIHNLENTTLTFT